MLSLKDRIKLVDELIEENKDARVKDYSQLVVEIEDEINQIEQSDSAES